MRSAARMGWAVISGWRVMVRLPVALLGLLAAAPAVETGRVWVVERGHPAAADANPGTVEAPLASVQAAVDRAGPGDTVRIGPGIYRECVRLPRGGEPGRPLRLVGASGWRSVITGSEPLAGPGDAVPGNPSLRRLALPAAPPGTWNPYAVDQRARPRATTATAAHLDGADAIAGGGDEAADRCLGQLFADDAPLMEVAARAEVEARPGTWWAEPEGRSLLVHLPPGCDPALVAWEASWRARCLWAAPGSSHIELRSLVFQRAANHFPVFGREGNGQQGMVATAGGRHWTVEGCLVRQARMIGLECGRLGGVDAPPRDRSATAAPPGFHRIVGNRFVANGLCGLVGMGATACLVAGNVVEGNGWQGLRGAEAAGIKLHRFTGGRIEGNLVRGNHAYGIWLDLGYQDCRVTRNVCLGNEGAGIFLELGDGPALVDRNVSAGNEGEGLYLHDASGVTALRNLCLGNAGWGIYARVVSDRSVRRRPDGGRDPAEASRIELLGNLVLDNRAGSVCLPWPWARSQGLRCEANAYPAEASRWQWHHQTGPRFAFDDCEGRVPHADVLTGLAAACAGLPEAERPRLDGSAGLPLFGLAAWQATGHDRAAALLRLKRGTRVHLGRPDLELTLLEPLPVTGTPSHPALRHDLLGAPLSDDGRPGPFSVLPVGRTRILLWPLPPSRDSG